MLIAAVPRIDHSIIDTDNKMSDPIIGGAIAAVIGAVCYAFVGLWLERRHEEAQRIVIVTDLIAEIVDNLLICTAPEIYKEYGIQLMTPYKLEAYRSYRGQMSFLPSDAISCLTRAAFVMEAVNSATQIYRSRAASGLPTGAAPIPVPGIVRNLESADKELRKWREKHTHEIDESLHCF